MVHKLCEHFTDPLFTYTYPKGARVCKTILDVNELNFTNESSNDSLSITYYPFPSPMRLAQPDVESKLRSLGFGYRAKFLARTAQVLCERVSCGKDMKPSDVDHAVYAHLLSLRNCTYGEARAKLMELPGIGPKVAEYVYYIAQCLLAHTQLCFTDVS